MIREASVASGTEFLTHPSVIPHSKEEKVSFLRGKGLTTEEIDEAFRRVESTRGAPTAPGTAPQAAAIGAQQPAVVYVPPPQPPPEPQWSFVSSVLAPLSLALSAGASALYFYKTYVLHEGNAFPWETATGGGLQPPPLYQEPP
jgi:peroxin-14